MRKRWMTKLYYYSLEIVRYSKCQNLKKGDLDLQNTYKKCIVFGNSKKFREIKRYIFFYCQKYVKS